MVFRIEATQNYDWLYRVIEKWLNSNRMFDQARALRILGFLDEKTVKKKLQTWINNNKPDSWVKQVAEISLKTFEKNEWAKWWFRDFCTHEDNIRAWGSFKVFLRCVDSRFWLWRKSLIDRIDKADRKQFYEENIENIKK